MNNIGSFGNDKFFNVKPINNVSPAAVNPATTGGATEVPSGAITVPSTTSDQFVSIGNRAVVNSGLVTSTKNDKNNNDINAWDSFAVAVEPGTDANAVLPLALNMKSEAPIQLTESSPQETKLVIAEFMKNTNGSNAAIAATIIDGLA
jgi:hypothetical protein